MRKVGSKVHRTTKTVNLDRIKRPEKSQRAIPQTTIEVLKTKQKYSDSHKLVRWWSNQSKINKANIISMALYLLTGAYSFTIDMRVLWPAMCVTTTVTFLVLVATSFNTGLRLKSTFFTGVYGLSTIICFALTMHGFDVHPNENPQFVYNLNETIFDYIYLSGMAFTGIGFGDVVPATKIARLTAVIEGIIGNIFIALIAGKAILMYAKLEPR